MTEPSVKQASTRPGPILLGAAWLIGMTVVVWCGFLPSGYLEHVRGIPPPHPFPVGTVWWVAVLMTVHVSILRALLHRLGLLRALGAMLVSFGFLTFAAMDAMHSPPAFGAYLGWLIAMFVLLLLLTAWTALATVVARSRARRHSASSPPIAAR